MSRFLDVIPNDLVTIEFLVKSTDIADPDARDIIRTLEDRLLGSSSDIRRHRSSKIGEYDHEGSSRLDLS